MKQILNIVEDIILLQKDLEKEILHSLLQGQIQNLNYILKEERVQVN